MNKFEHGGDVTAFARACGCKIDEVIDLSSNINFVTPRITLNLTQLNTTSYPHYEALREAVAGRYEVEVEQLGLFNGASSAIFSFLRQYKTTIRATHPSRSAVCTIYAPAYLEYRRAAEQMGYGVHTIDRLNGMDDPVAEGSLVIFVNPATPDGAHYDLESLLAQWAAKECTVLIDESFIDFTPHASATQFLDRYPDLIVLKSMTKYYGAAGVRVGALVADPERIAAIMDNEPLWMISAFDSAWMQSALQDKGFKTRSQQENTEAKAELIRILKNTSLMEHLYPSEANFILVKLSITAKAFQARLTPHRILVRSCENFDGLDRYHVRLAVKSLEALEALQKALIG